MPAEYYKVATASAFSCLTESELSIKVFEFATIYQFLLELEARLKNLVGAT